MKEAITFRDVLLAPKRSAIRSRKDVDTTGRFSRKLSLKCPIVSANMDTVTEAAMAIAMARCGGLGIIHRFLSIKDEVSEVAKVKRAENIIIEDPYTLGPDATVAHARAAMSRHEVGGMLIVDAQRRLLGVVAQRDLQFREDSDLPLRKVMSKDLITAKPGISEDVARQLLSKHKIEKLPLVDAHGVLVGLITARDLKMRELHPEASKDARDLAEAGADGIKVGVGPGSICITRIVSGSGVPQLTAIMDCAQVTKQYGVPIVADGGIRDSGDITKALAGGASTVMLGSLLAGTEESPGWTVVRDGARYKIYRGMASLTATLSRKKREHRCEADLDPIEVAEVVPEGVESAAPYRGPVNEVVHQLAGGLRSGMSYSGAHNLKEFWRKAEFIRISQASWAESRPHALDR
jgi:IMP dehydrogenase